MLVRTRPESVKLCGPDGWKDMPPRNVKTSFCPMPRSARSHTHTHTHTNVSHVHTHMQCTETSLSLSLSLWGCVGVSEGEHAGNDTGPWKATEGHGPSRLRAGPRSRTAAASCRAPISSAGGSSFGRRPARGKVRVSTAHPRRWARDAQGTSRRRARRGRHRARAAMCSPERPCTGRRWAQRPPALRRCNGLRPRSSSGPW